MRIIVIGTRGIPDILGGVETHCQELYPRLLYLGHNITVITRRQYVKNRKKRNYLGVQLKHIYAPNSKSFEAIIHTFLGIIYAKLKKPDYLHIHAVGPMLLTPFAKLLGLNVIVTHHGHDYNRKKWGKTAKYILKLGERMGVKYADKVIVISKGINQNIKDKYNRLDAIILYNGVNLSKKSSDTNYLNSLGLTKQEYILAVGRFVPEKGFTDLIKAFSNIKTDLKLVLVGDVDHKTQYDELLRKQAKENDVVLTGFITGEKLNQIYSYARLFVLPSYHEGLPISLLEAMSYNLDVLVSDIPPNVEINLEKEDYFKVGDIKSLKNSLQKKLSKNTKRDFSEILKERYDWNQIANKFSDILK